jgi:hypothetical protein
MWNNFGSKAHIYPYVDTGVVYIKQSNFDWDHDGSIVIVSKYKQGINANISGEDDWSFSKIPIEQSEIGSSLDFQLSKRQGELVKNNNVVVTIENQFEVALPFFSSPIGGVPVYQSRIKKEKLLPQKK